MVSPWAEPGTLVQAAWAHQASLTLLLVSDSQHQTGTAGTARAPVSWPLNSCSHSEAMAPPSPHPAAACLSCAAPGSPPLAAGADTCSA